MITVQPSVFAGQEMIPLGVVVVAWVLVVGCVVVVRPVVVWSVVVGGGIVSVVSPVSVSIVIGGPVAVVIGWLDSPPAAPSSSSVAARATIAPAARATSRSEPSAIQSQTGDSRDQTIVRVYRGRGSGTSRRPHSRQYSWSGS
jgi:hypothetical protein